MVVGQAASDGEPTEGALPAQPSLDLPTPPYIPLPTIRKPPTEPENVVRWNTSNLGLRLGADASSAATASILVAPLICVIDRSIVEKASTNTPLTRCLLHSLRPALRSPHTFLTSRPFLLIFTLYFSTYLTANSIDTLTSTIKSAPHNTVTASPTKFIATAAVNMSVCVYKDSQFARLFGATSSSTSKIPRLSYLLFAARDSMTIFASFNVPPLLAPRLAHLPPSIQKKFNRILSTESARTNTAQFIAPAAMQIFSTPVHLLGLDLYNRQGRLGFGQRFARVARDWGVSALARMGRIVPAFGVGGVVNGGVRRDLMARLEG